MLRGEIITDIQMGLQEVEHLVTRCRTTDTVSYPKDREGLTFALGKLEELKMEIFELMEEL
jgi:hypothetical protein